MMINNISRLLLNELNSDVPDLLKVREYIDNGADINLKSESDGYTALMVAVDHNDESLVLHILQLGGDPLLRNIYNEIAIELSLKYSGIYQILKECELNGSSSFDFNELQLIPN